MVVEALTKKLERMKNVFFSLRLDLTKKEWLILASLSTVSFSSGVVTSLQGPIYPPEAEMKGVSATEYGMVFGIFDLVAFIISPIYGKYMDKIGAKFLTVGGLAVSGATLIAFGMLDLVDTYLVFISLSFTFRILAAVGCSAEFIASFSISAVIFAGKIATVYAIFECCFGLGFSLGPILATSLFQVGGFILPFAVVGVFLWSIAILLFFTLPNIRRKANCDLPVVGILAVLKIPSALLDFISIIVANINLGFNVATLESNLRQFNLSKAGIGGMFGISAGFYMVSTAVVGRLCDNRVSAKKLIILGCVLATVGFSLLGPLPFLDVEPTLWMVGPGLALFGTGLSCVMVPGFSDAIKAVVKGGLPDNLGTYSVVSGFSTSCVFLGASIGPTVGGALLDAVGYRWASLFIVMINSLMVFVMIVYVCSTSSLLAGTKSDESSQKHDPNKGGTTQSGYNQMSL